MKESPNLTEVYRSTSLFSEESAEPTKSLCLGWLSQPRANHRLCQWPAQTESILLLEHNASRAEGLVSAGKRIPIMGPLHVALLPTRSSLATAGAHVPRSSKSSLDHQRVASPRWNILGKSLQILSIKGFLSISTQCSSFGGMLLTWSPNVNQVTVRSRQHHLNHKEVDVKSIVLMIESSWWSIM